MMDGADERVIGPPTTKLPLAPLPPLIPPLWAENESYTTMTVSLIPPLASLELIIGTYQRTWAHIPMGWVIP